MEKGCTHFEGGSAGSPVRFVRNAQSVDAATLRQLVQPGRVHSAVYTSPDIFEAEIERIFHGSWLYVGHASEVPQKGDYRVRRLGRQPVIMVRGHDDVVRVLMNRCRHRGAAVCEQEAGREKVF